MPASIQERLAKVAHAKGYRSPEHLLCDPPKRWLPSLPIGEVAQYHIEKAMRTRNALRRAISVSLDPYSPRGEWLRLAVEGYRSEFGRVSERHVCRIVNRVFERDGGVGRFDDVALYLDEKLSRRAPASTAVARCDEERMIIDRANSISNPHNPSRTQIELLWCVICEALDLMVGRNVPQKKARRSIVAVLICISVRLAKNETALRDLVKSKYERWVEGGRTLDALRDQRSENSGWHRSPGLPAAVLDKLVGHAIVNCGGRESQAWRELMQAGELPADFHATYTSTPSRKSYMPTSIRRAVTPEVNRLHAIHRGPREARLQGAHHTRSYAECAAGDWLQSDDLTPPVYFHTLDARGDLSLMRGQFLPMLDVRSAKILGFVLISSAQYDSLAIRDLITRVCLEHGLPRQGFYFEKGLWKSSRIIAGGKNALPWDEADRGLRGLGLKLMHAKLPRGKVVENVLGILQNQMERMPGYVGRDESKDKFERAQRDLQLIRAGHEAPEDHLLGEEGITKAFAEIIARYNDEPQEGRLNGLSPNEAWRSLQKSGEPLQRFDHRTAWILAHDVRKVRVGRNGITIRIGKRGFNYKGEETGKRVGEEVIARFNPSCPDILAFHTVGSSKIVFAELAPETPAFGAGEIFERNEALIDAHNAYARRRYHIVKNALPDQCFRVNLVDYRTAETARAIEARQTEVKRTRAIRVDVESAAGRAGLLVQPGSRIDGTRAQAARKLEKMLKEGNDQ